MTIELPALPYPKNALEPYLSSETLSVHHGEHHAAYVNNLNKLLAGDEEPGSLEDLIRTSEGSIFNNAAQIWNHTFYWSSMKPGGGGEPRGDLLDAVVRDFGGVERLREELTQAAIGQFGSGWAWLVLHDGKLEVTKTSNADTPLRYGQKALLTIDVWEHAYYIDYRNLRPRYVEAFFDKLVNWDFALQNLRGV
jgi:superoxide dismutase, Fe-Mn family